MPFLLNLNISLSEFSNILFLFLYLILYFQGDILPVGFPIYGDRGNWQDGVGLGLEKGGNWQERPQENWRGRQRGNWQIEDSRNWHDGARGEWQEEGRDRNNRQRQAEEDRHEEEGGDWQEEFSNEFWRTETQGFQNPWEALHAMGACTGNNIQVSFFFVYVLYHLRNIWFHSNNLNYKVQIWG